MKIVNKKLDSYRKNVVDLEDWDDLRGDRKRQKRRKKRKLRKENNKKRRRDKNEKKFN